MDTMQMSYILSLSKENYNITQTAKQLYITQAALSKSLHNAEDKLNAELFVRENGRLAGLTPAGKIFISHAKQILDIYQLMCDELSSYSGVMSGSFRIGIPGDLVDVLFYSALPKLIMAYPSVQLNLTEKPAQELEQLFISNELDILIALDHNQSDRSIYERVHLASQPYGVFLDRLHPLASCPAITWAQLKDYPLALPIKSHTRMLVLSELMKRNFSPHIAVNACSNRMLIRSVQDSQIITVLPRIFYNSNIKANDSILWIPLYSPLKWDVEILMKKKHRESNDIVCRMFDCIREIDLTQELSSAQDESKP